MSDPGGEGAEAFMASVSSAGERSYLADARYRFWLAHAPTGELLGFIASRDARHVFHLFVDRGFQRRGLARTLWRCMLAEAGPASAEEPYTVNASLNAVPAYRALGFVESGPAVRRHGVAFTPMRCTRTRG
nr:GNAT family N-acetyltransferase [Pelomonas sp. P8]